MKNRFLRHTQKGWWVEKWDDLLDWFDDRWSDVAHPFRKLRHAFKYFCYVYKEECWDWDYSYLLGILQFKFKGMREYALKYGHLVGSGRQAKQYKLCSDLIERIVSHNYVELETKNHDRKWGELHVGSVTVGRDGVIHKEIIFHRKNINTPEEKKQERSESDEIYKRERDLRDQDIKYLFNTMSKRLLLWYD